MTDPITTSSRGGSGRAAIRAGFLPLTDAAPLVVAALGGFAAKEGIRIDLVREASWATLRDRIAVGNLDVAQALAPLPIAANLGLTPLSCRMIVPLGLGAGGNTVTVGRELWERLRAAGAPRNFDARAAGAALARVVAARRSANARPLVIAVVHPHSAHRYQLAYWLRSCGIVPDRDVELVVAPPSLMPAALAGGQIDAFTAGEPWGSVAVREAGGVILTTNVGIWRGISEKVLGVREAWGQQEPDKLDRLVRAVYAAAVWSDAPANAPALAELLAASGVPGRPVGELGSHRLDELPGPEGGQQQIAGFLSFSERAAARPHKTHALLFLAQMISCGDAKLSAANLELAASTYRPDLFARALGGAAPDDAPAAALGPETFFDGRRFVPAHLESGDLGFEPPLR